MQPISTITSDFSHSALSKVNDRNIVIRLLCWINSGINKAMAFIIRKLVRLFARGPLAACCACLLGIICLVALLPLSPWLLCQLRKALLYPAAYGLCPVQEVKVQKNFGKRGIYATAEELQPLEGENFQVRAWLLNRHKTSKKFTLLIPQNAQSVTRAANAAIKDTDLFVRLGIDAPGCSNLLFVERPNEGESTGDVSIEAQAAAVLAGIAYLKKQGATTINLTGISMGCAAILEAVASALESDAKPWGKAQLNLYLLAAFSEVHLISRYIPRLVGGPNNGANLLKIYDYNVDADTAQERRINTYICNSKADDMISYEKASLEQFWINQGIAGDTGIYCPGAFIDLTGEPQTPSYSRYAHNDRGWSDIASIMTDVQDIIHPHKNVDDEQPFLST